MDAVPHVSVRRFADPRSLATMLRAARVALTPVPTRSVTREKNLSHAFVCEQEFHGMKKIRARGGKRLAGSRAHAMVRLDSHRLSRNHDEQHARWYCRLERRERHDATFYGTQEPAGGADKSLGRNRTGGLCANVHWVGNGFPAARSSILRMSRGV